MMRALGFFCLLLASCSSPVSSPPSAPDSLPEWMKGFDDSGTVRESKLPHAQERKDFFSKAKSATATASSGTTNGWLVLLGLALIVAGALVASNIKASWGTWSGLGLLGLGLGLVLWGVDLGGLHFHWFPLEGHQWLWVLGSILVWRFIGVIIPKNRLDWIGVLVIGLIFVLSNTFRGPFTPGFWALATAGVGLLHWTWYAAWPKARGALFQWPITLAVAYLLSIVA